MCDDAFGKALDREMDNDLRSVRAAIYTAHEKLLRGEDLSEWEAMWWEDRMYFCPELGGSVVPGGE